MNLFEKELEKAYLKYHTEPVSNNSLDPRVFDFSPVGNDPTLNSAIKLQILNDTEQLNSLGTGVKLVWDYIIVGPVLKQGSSDKCDITVMVEFIKDNLTDIVKERILNTLKDINGRLATGTVHPLVYVPTVRPLDINNYLAAYHPYTDKWIKKPRFLGEAKNHSEKINKLKTNPRHRVSLKLKKLGNI